MSAGKTFEEVVDLYLDRCHLGDAPDIVAFAAEHPEHSDELLETLPLLDDLEHIGDAARGRSVLSTHDLPELPGSDFKLIRKIGSGGMGVVFEACQISLDRPVAVKLLAPSLVSNAERRTQFEHEARLVATLQHPGIVKVIGAGQSAGTCYYAMELIKGERLDRHAFSSLREIARAGLQAARALAYAHDQQVMHRDIKPSNLLLDESGTLHIADFGLACVLEVGHDAIDRPGAQNGTLRYMPAERLIHGISSFSGDQYALGATLYELITHRPILQERSATRLFRRICSTPVPPLSCAESDLAAIINKCVSFDPRDRYASMHDLAEDLRRFLDHEPVLASPAPAGRRLVLWIRRKPAVAALTTVAAVCAIGAVTALSVGYARTADALRLAERNASLAGAALSGVFRSVENQPPSRRDTLLLTEMLPYYGELARRQDMPADKVAEANRILGTCAFRTGNYALAEKAFRHLSASNPTAADRNNLADALRRQGRDDEASTIYREVADRFSTSTNAVDRFESVRALKALAQDDYDSPDRAQAFQIVSDLLKESPGNPEYRFQYALILGANPRFYAGQSIPNLKPNPTLILNQLADEYPDRPEYGLALVDLVDHRLRTIRNPKLADRNDFSLAIERADRLLGRFPNMPDVVSAVIRMRSSYATFLRKAGSKAMAEQVQARTSGMLEMLTHSSETPASQRFVFNSTNGVSLAYRQIAVNRSVAGPATLVMILHGKNACGSDNVQQLATPTLMPLLEYVQMHDEKTVILLPQCPRKLDWKKLRPVVDELARKKAREFRVRPRHIIELGENIVSEEEIDALFQRTHNSAPFDR
ncbi:MAG: protein kinase [Kiritimatiellia bacterium]